MKPPPADTSSSPDDPRPTIFAVDDEPMLLDLIAMVLRPLGFQVRTFRDPDAAVRAFTEASPPPVLVVTDYSMHTMTGMDLIRACRRIHPHQKIILASGTVDESIMHDAEAKPDAFLPKPYQAGQLADLVRVLLTK